MSFLDRLEKKIGKFAIPHLMIYVCVCYIAGYLLFRMGNIDILSALSLNAEAICHGQIWRIVTFIIQPPTSSSFFFFLLTIYCYFSIGEALERRWGTFKFNVYIFGGLILNVAISLVVFLIFGINLSMTLYYVNLSLFMAYAVVQPDAMFLFFFFIPMRAKWLAIIDGIYFGATVIFGLIGGIVGLPMNVRIILYSIGVGSSMSEAICAILAVANMLIFFYVLNGVRYKKTKAQKAYRKNFKVYESPPKKDVKSAGAFAGGAGPVHKCAICGKTELDDPDETFRYCSKCSSPREYCSDHIDNHEHI